jgi:hypothetical protein
MIVLFAFYLLVALAFLLVHAAIYRPLFSRHYPGEFDDVIPSVSGVRLTQLQHWVSDEMTELIRTTLSPKEQRLITWRRPRMIARELEPFEANARLLLAFSRPQMRLLRRKPPGPRSERDRLIAELYQRSRYCCLLLSFAKMSRFVLRWDRQRMIRFHRETVVAELREMLTVLLRLAETYAEHRRDNLLAWLDCWELSEEYPN